MKARRNEARRLRAQDPQVLRREADARRRSRHAKKGGAALRKRDSSHAASSEVIAPSLLIKGTLPPTMAEPAHNALSPEVSHSQRTQASVNTAHMGTQCNLGSCTSVGCQTEAGFPGGEVDTFEHGVSFGRHIASRKGAADNWARVPAGQQGEHGCTHGSSDAGKFARSHRRRAQTRGSGQSCDECAYPQMVVTFPRTVPDRKTSVTCSMCRAVFSDRGSLYTHMVAHSGEKPYSCPSCPKSFCRRENLALHERSHAGERRFVCSVCQRGFSTGAHLVIHERSHAATEHAFVCAVCQKGFARRACLLVHQTLHTGGKSYACLHCSESFTRKDKFFAHERSHTGEKPFPCSACQKSFAARRDLVIHERSHTGERPYVCDTCREGFTSKKRLDSHKRLHTAGTPFVCTPCQLSFTSNDCLLRHIKNVPHELQVNVNITKLGATKSSM